YHWDEMKIGSYGRRAGTDLHFIPVIRLGLHDELRLSPIDQVGRVGNPDGPWGNFRVWTVQASVQSSKHLGKDHYIPVVGLSDEGNSFQISRKESLGLGQGNPHTVSRVRTVGDEVLAIQQCHARILHAKLLIRRK